MINMKKNQWIFTLIIFFLMACSKEEIIQKKQFIYIQEFIKSALPNKLSGTVNYKDKNGNAISFYANGSYYNSPRYKNDPNPFEFIEKYKWEYKNSADNNYTHKIEIDSIGYSPFYITFRLRHTNAPDSIYEFRHYIQPKDSIYNTLGHQFYKTYRIGTKEFQNCFEIINLSINKKFVYSHTQGILYFEAAFGQNFTINQ